MKNIFCDAILSYDFLQQHFWIKISFDGPKLPQNMLNDNS